MNDLLKLNIQGILKFMASKKHKRGSNKAGKKIFNTKI